jgi:hypothetical protein
MPDMKAQKIALRNRAGARRRRWFLDRSWISGMLERTAAQKGRGTTRHVLLPPSLRQSQLLG